MFDLDNTLVRGSSLFHLGVFMVRRRRLAIRHLLRFALSEAGYVLLRREPAGISSTVAQRTLGLVTGMRQSDLLDVVDDFVARDLDRLLVPEVRLQLRDFQGSGFITVLATASPQELATAVAARLGMSAAVGTTSEVRNGRYTGHLDGPIAHGQHKADRVALVFDELGIDAAQSWAFSDSINDRPLLSMVGRAVAVDPDPRLRALSKERGWRVFTCAGDDEAPWAGYDVFMPFPY